MPDFTPLPLNRTFVGIPAIPFASRADVRAVAPGFQQFFASATAAAGQGSGEYPVWLRFRGRIEVLQAGDYAFSLTSAHGSKLFVDSAEVVDNDGQHSQRTRQGTVYLEAGLHTLVVAAVATELGVSVHWTPPNATMEQPVRITVPLDLG